MKQSLFIIFIALLCIPHNLKSQEYFQQEVNYSIQVKLNDSLHELSAFESIEYINNSRETLSFIYMHLWPNAYKNNGTALAKQFLAGGETKMYFASPKDLGYIDSLNFRVDNKNVDWQLDSIHIDICKIRLNEPLLPGKKITISTPFHVKIPNGEISRMGHIGQSYMISQWYPKPAVFDAEGWHPMPYLNQGEFYSEFGSFDVSITLPSNYVVGATGDMAEDANELNWLNEKAKKTNDFLKSYNNGTLQEALDERFPESAKDWKTLRYRQTNVHDFAWFCDKCFHVLKGEVILPHSKRKVTTWAMFTNDRIDLWQYAIAYLNDATFFYSLWNGDYQYKQVTAVDGTISAGGGMEYPNVTIIGSSNTAFNLETVIMHEVGHNWFYGMLGSNERDIAWMDEGINSFNEMRYVFTKYPQATMPQTLGLDSAFKLFAMNKIPQRKSYEYFYKYIAAAHNDQPCNLKSPEFTEQNYGGIVYAKTAVLFYYLMNYMGEENFDKAMKFYFDRWKFKHPKPTDLREVMEYFSEKKLDWFFDDLLGTSKQIDYAIQSYKKSEDGNYEVVVKNKGGVSGPVPLCGTNKGKIRGMVWYDGFEGEKTLSFPAADIDAFKIDYFEYVPELNRSNNTMRMNGLFRKTEPIKLRLLAGFDAPTETSLYYTPILGFNNYNKLMLGIAAYNHAFYQKKVEFELLPLFSLGTKDLCGYSNLSFNVNLDKGFAKDLSFGVNTARFAYNNEPIDLNFTKLAPFLVLNFKKKTATSPISSSIKYRNVIVYKEKAFLESVAPGGTEKVYSRKIDQTSINDVVYSFANARTINPYKLLLNWQFNGDMNKLSASFNYYITLKNKKAFELRIFAGNMFKADPNHDYRFRMSGQIGKQDYLYDNIYIGRSADHAPDVAAQQFTETDGAFKAFSYSGQSDRWLTSLNIKSPNLFKLPLLFYFDLGAYSAYIKNGNTGQVTVQETQLVYGGGVGIPIIKDYFEIFIPAFNSSNFIGPGNLANSTGRFVDRIRFKIDFNAGNPFKFIKKSSLF